MTTRRIWVKILLAFSLLVLTCVIAYLSVQGYRYSTFLGAFLLGVSILQINPAKVAFRRRLSHMPFDVMLVSRIGLSFAVLVEFILVNLGMNIIKESIGILDLEVIQKNLMFIVVVLMVGALFLWQELFIGWEHLDQLSQTDQRRYLEVVIITFGLSWFLATGGGLVINFIIIPLISVYLLIRDSLKQGMMLFHRRIRSRSLARWLSMPGTVKKSFWATWLKSSRSPETTWLALILFSSAEFLTLNIKFYSFGDLYQTVFLILLMVPVVLSYFGIRNEWKTPQCFVTILPLLLTLPIVLMLPLSVPIINFGISTMTYGDLISAIMQSKYIFSLFLLAWFLIVLGGYELVLAHFLFRRGKRDQSIGRIKKLWRRAEILLLISLFPSSAVGAIIGEAELAVAFFIISSLSMSLLFEIGLVTELEDFKQKVREVKMKEEYTNVKRHYLKFSRKLTIEALVMQLTMPLLLLFMLWFFTFLGVDFLSAI